MKSFKKYISWIISIVVIIGVVFVTQLIINQQVSEPTEPGYYVLTDDSDDNQVIAFEGCGNDYLKYINAPDFDLQEALDTIFALSDPELTSLYHSNVTPEVTEFEDRVEINLTGDLITGGTCDTPKIINQIRRTVELFIPENKEYIIMLNSSEPDFNCFGDESGFCE